MNFNDLKDQLSHLLHQLWDRFHDSTLFNRLRDRYENLNPQKQKIVLAVTALLAILIVLQTPWIDFQESTENMSQFEERRDLIRKLLKVGHESAEKPQIPEGPSIDNLRSMISSRLENSRILPDQIKSIDSAGLTTQLVPTELSKGSLQVSLSKLNLRQIVEIGQQFVSISPSVKMVGLKLGPNSEDPRYFDTVYSFVSLNVPVIAPPPVIEEDIPAKDTKKKKKSSNENSDQE